MTPEVVTTGCFTLWFRSDLTREEASEYWSGPHGDIVAGIPGAAEYLQHHLSATDHGFWPVPKGVGATVPPDWRIDGMPEARLLGGGSAFRLRTMSSMRAVFLDEQNAFQRVLRQMSGPRRGRWWTGPYDRSVEQRGVVLLRSRKGLRPGAFQRFLHDTLGAALLSAGARELRTHAFRPGSRFMHWTPGVAHDDPAHRRYAGAVVIGAEDRGQLDALLAAPALRATDAAQAEHCVAIHAYAVDRTVPVVLDGRVLPRSARRG
jgi:hypothetical protein